MDQNPTTNQNYCLTGSGCKVSKNTQITIEKDKTSPTLDYSVYSKPIQDIETTKNGFKYSDG